MEAKLQLAVEEEVAAVVLLLQQPESVDFVDKRVTRAPGVQTMILTKYTEV